MIWPRSELPHDYAETLIAIEGRIQRYVVIELKAVLFDHACVGRINVYLSAVDDLLRHPDDKPTIGLLLVSDSSTDRIVVEYALRDVRNMPTP